MTTTPPRRRRLPWVAASAVLLVTLTTQSPGSAASPGDPLTSFGTGGVLRVSAPSVCGSCPTTASELSRTTLESNGAVTVLGYGWSTEGADPDARPSTGAAVAATQGGAAPWRAEVSGPDPTEDRVVLAVGVQPGASRVIAVVGVIRRGATADDPDVPVGQEIRRYTLAGALDSTVTLPAGTDGAWSTAAVGPDGSVVGVVEDTGAGDLPATTVRRYGLDGALRWTRALAVGDSIDAVDISSSGAVVLAGARATPADEAYDGLIVGLTDAGAPDAAYGSGGARVFPAAPGYGRGFADVDASGADVAAVGDDQYQGEDDDDLAPGAAVIVRLQAGQPVTGFSGDGILERPWADDDGLRLDVSGVLLDGSRTLISGGSTASDGFHQRAVLTRFTASGAIDAAFSIDGEAAPGLRGLAPVSGGYAAVAPAAVDTGAWTVPVMAFAAEGTTAAGPPPPSSVRLTAAGAGTATVAWTPPGASVTGYELLTDTDRDQAPDNVNPAGLVTSAPMQGLPADRVLSFALRSRGATGVGRTSAWTTPSIPPFRTVDAFTDRQFRDFAGRAPTTAELNAWRSALTGNEHPSDRIDQAIGFSTWDPVRGPIIRLYRAYFLRLPDTPGLDYWVNRSRAGASLSSISAFFAVSPEFKQRYGTLTNRQFVERIYQNILGRPGEPSGSAFWTEQLDSGRRSRGWVMIGFSESPEYKRSSQPTVDLVNVYTGMLRRVPTRDERELWLSILSSGAARTRVIAHLLSSSEYDERIPS